MLVGREEALRWLSARVADAWAGTGPVACTVVGPAGIGKSALLRAGVPALKADLVLDVCGIASESSTPYDAARSLWEPLRDSSSEMPAANAAVFRRLVDGEPLHGVTPVALRLAVRAALQAAAHRRVLVVVDDAQWVDAESMAVVRFLVQRPSGHAAFVLAQRDHSFTDVRAAELHLGPLPSRAARTILRTAAPGLSRLAADQLIRLADGNPLALSLMERSLSDAQRAGSAPILAPEGHTATERLYQSVIEQLQPDELLAGAVVAAEASGSSPTMAAAMELLGISPDATARLREAGLVTADGQQCSFTHPLARAELYGSVDDAARRRVHAALAQATTGDASVWQLAAAATAPSPEAVAALVELGGRSWASGALPTAAMAFERAARLAPAAERVGLLGRVAAAALAGGQFEMTIRVAEEMLAAEPEPADRATALLTMSVAGLLLGRPMSLAELEREATRLLPEQPWWAARLYGFVTTNLAMEYRIDDALRVAELAKAADPAPEGWVGNAYVHAVAGDRTKAWECLERSAPPGEVVRDLVGRANVRMFLEDTAALEADLRAWLAAPSAAQFPRAYGLSLLADCCVRRGAWHEARDHIAASLDESEAGDSLLGRTRALGLAVRLDAAQANWDAGELALAELTDLIGDRAEGVISSWYRGVVGFFRLSAGDPEGCAEVLAPLLHIARQGRWNEPSYVPFAADLVEAALRLGDRRLAEETAGVLAAQVAHTASTSAEGLLERCRGLLQPERAALHLERASAAHALADRPFDAARTRLALGTVLNDRTALAAALDQFRTMGATAWSRMAEATLAGGAAPAPSLSAQQLAVARAAARGATTREIAAELFISVKTVEYHLGRLYRRYDVRNRAQLASALREHNTV